MSSDRVSGATPTCLVLQHVAPEGPYTLATALTEAGIAIDLRQIYAADELPADLNGYDALIVMGGPMSVTSDAGFATRQAELALVREAIKQEIPTLGLCLGAQLIAAAAGAAVFPGDRGPEIGWGPVRLTPAAHADAFFAATEGELNVMHWHGDTFSLPSGAVLLATNSTYENQAFRIGSSAWGLQFHVEVDEAAVAAFLAAFRVEAERAGSDPTAIAAATPAAVAELTPFRRAAFARFADLVWSRFDAAGAEAAAV